MGAICCVKTNSLDLVANYEDLIFIMQSDIELLDKQIVIKKNDKKVNVYQKYIKYNFIIE